jgi:hypothetical protein
MIFLTLRNTRSHSNLSGKRHFSTLYCAYVFHQLFIFVADYSVLINRYLFVRYSIFIRLIVVQFLILNRVQVFRSCYLLTITIIKSSQ